MFGEFGYAARTWDRRRRVLIKAEHGARGANPRYVLTNLTGSPQRLYERVYCARGDMENRINEPVCRPHQSTYRFRLISVLENAGCAPVSARSSHRRLIRHPVVRPPRASTLASAPSGGKASPSATPQIDRRTPFRQKLACTIH